MSNTRTGRPVSNKLVIDIDMDSVTAAEFGLSLKTRSFLNRVNDRLRKMLNSSIQCKTLTNVLWFGECLCLRHWKHLCSWEKNYSNNLHSIKNTENLFLKRCSRCLNSWYWNNRVRFFGVSQISWESSNIFTEFTTLELVHEVQKFHEQCERTRRSIFMSMTKTMKRNVSLIPHLCLYSQEDFQKDVGHSLDLGQKQSGTPLTKKDQEENEIESLNRWW